MRDLGSLASANDVNDAGQVVGQSENHAFITGPNGMGMRDLGTLGGTGFYNNSDASDINSVGQVVGYSAAAGGTYHAFITGPDGMGMRDLGTLRGAIYENSFAHGINDAGQVVGNSSTADGSQHAFITGPNGTGMMDLNSLVDMPGGMVLNGATGINNAGQVVAFVIPEPKIFALFLVGLALVGFIAQRKKMDARALCVGLTFTSQKVSLPMLPYPANASPPASRALKLVWSD